MKVREYKRITEEIFKLMDEGVHVIDANGKTIIYNEAMAQLEKMDQKDVLKKNFNDVFKNLDENNSTLLRALKKQTTENRLQTYKNIDGKEITTINSSYPVILEDKVIGAIEIAKNITEIQEMSKTILKLHSAPAESKEGKKHKIKEYHFSDIIGQNKKFLEVIEKAMKASRSNASVLIYGETGTGKELVAQSIHYDGIRKDKPFLAQNFAALPGSLLEGILFGTAKGGFTGAVDRIGLFEQADGGTLLLDEISAMPYELQGKLLRVLQEDYIRRVGGTEDIPIDVRIIATINEPAESLIEKGKLRKDLYYRLRIIPINIPPLRERRDDILLLAEKFLAKHNRINDKQIWMISDRAKEKLMEYDYPGNVRELENIIMAGVSMIEEEHVLDDEHLTIDRDNKKKPASLEEVTELGLNNYLSMIESHLIDEAMSINQGNISKAAKQLGIKRQTLQHKLKKNNIVG
ncbi:MAG: sigma 54-interacting transcriptional regulator [Clostridiales bacterium]|jgi:arginine utilization regulatory protein|nr:sigma 54-interacting transcriptional regulator [Clostridiales bacterium]